MALAAWDLRPAGLHPLLGQVPQGILGGEAEDRRGPAPARSQAHRGLVSAHRHEPVRDQWTALKRKLLGHFGYFGITGNYQALHNFSVRVIGAWRKWLSRRSQRAWISVEKMRRLLERYPLPQPRIRTSPVT